MFSTSVRTRARMMIATNERQSSRFIPCLELLEDRTVPTGGYSFTTLDPSGSAFTTAYGINSSGHVTGTFVDSTNFNQHGFELYKGHSTTIDVSNATFGTSLFGINASGKIVGSYFDSNFTQHGVLVNGNTFTNIDDPNATFFSEAVGINAPGQIVGAYAGDDGIIHGYLYSHGQFTQIDNPAAGTGFFQGTYTFGINSFGQIAGSYVDANYGFHGFLYSGGQFTTIDDPNATHDFFAGTFVQGMNDQGQLVGSYTDSNFINHGFVYSAGQFTTIDNPNAAFGTDGLGINNAGTVVGDYTDGTFTEHGYMATPVHGNSPVNAGSPLASSPASLPRTKLPNDILDSLPAGMKNKAMRSLDTQLANLPASRTSVLNYVLGQRTLTTADLSNRLSNSLALPLVNNVRLADLIYSTNTGRSASSTQVMNNNLQDGLAINLNGIV